MIWENQVVENDEHDWHRKIKTFLQQWFYIVFQCLLHPKMNCTVRFGKQFSESSPCLPGQQGTGQQGWYASGTLRKQFTKPTVQFILGRSTFDLWCMYYIGHYYCEAWAMRSCERDTFFERFLFKEVEDWDDRIRFWSDRGLAAQCTSECGRMIIAVSPSRPLIEKLRSHCLLPEPVATCLMRWGKEVWQWGRCLVD